ncbi:MAG: ChbG/HpnK family deacetylase, partial [Candidatus Micrarchaeota archaeon]|nr:ChbG/HpnK family deacetylase [Candidatus Micrarchaeota archaeon]
SEQAEQLRKLAELRNWKGVSVGLHFEADNSKSIGPQMVEQHAKFRQIFGFEPSHFDIHKQITNTEIINALNSYAEQLHMPVRNHGIRAKTRQPDDQVFFSTFKRIDEIRDYLDKLEYDKTYEMLTHPGRYDPKSESSLNQEREEDMRNLAWIDEYLKTRKDIQKISYFNI